MASNFFWGSNVKLFIGGKEFNMKPEFKLGDKVTVGDVSGIFEIKSIDGIAVWLKQVDLPCRITTSIDRISLVPKPFAEVAFYDGRNCLHVAGRPIAGTNNTRPGSIQNYNKQELEELAQVINLAHKENHVS